MFAVVEIAGQQFKVSPETTLLVPKLPVEAGTSVRFERVFLLGNDRETKTGNPTLPGSFVEAKVVRHVKGEKVNVFKKKRRKGYKVLRGHRQEFTQIRVTAIQ
jgi:large subunit ribosomal protein L21